MGENLEIHWKDYLTHPGMSFGEFLAFTQPNKFALWSKIGYNGDVDVGVEDLWTVGGEYAYLAAETQLAIVSDSAEDDPVKADTSAGTGAWSVTVYYLNSLGVEKSVSSPTNGTAEVNLTISDLYRVQNMRVSTVGTAKKAVGNIDLKLKAAVGSTIYTRISAGHNRARNSSWTVPKGKRLHVLNIGFSVGSTDKANTATVIFSTQATYDDKLGTAITFFMPYHETLLMDNVFNKDLSPYPTTLPAGVDLKVRAQGLTANCICTSVLRGVVETI